MLNLLSLENKTVSMSDNDNFPTSFQYGVLDYTETDNIDYQFVPLIITEWIKSPIVDVKVGDGSFMAPIDWHIIIGDKETSELELVEIKSLIEKNFDAFVFNPITGFLPNFEKIKIENVYPEMNWEIPELRYGCLLVCPISNGDNPDCVFIVGDTRKIPEIIDLGDLF